MLPQPADFAEPRSLECGGSFALPMSHMSTFCASTLTSAFEIAWVALRTNHSEPAIGTVRWGLILGTAIALIGAAGIGGLLTGSPDHYPTSRRHKASRIPLAGWSVQRGDFQIAHFVGLHALQGLFAMSLMLIRVQPRRARAILIFIALIWLIVVAVLAGLAVDGRASSA